MEEIGVVRPEVTSVDPFSAPATGGVVITVTGFSLWRRSGPSSDEEYHCPLRSRATLSPIRANCRRVW